MKNHAEVIMSPEIQRKNLSAKVSIETLAILDTMARRADISRSKLIHNIIEATIDEMEMGRKIGFFQMTILIRNFNEKITGVSGKKSTTVTKEEKTVPVRLSSDYSQKLEILAKMADRSPHYLMKNFIQIGAEELNTTLAKSIIPLAIMVKGLKAIIKSLCNQGEKAMESYHAEIK
jgi:predicted DNA-binding protein